VAHSLFSGITQKSMEKSYRLFVNGMKVIQMFRLAFKIASSLPHILKGYDIKCTTLFLKSLQEKVSVG